MQFSTLLNPKMNRFFNTFRAVPNGNYLRRNYPYRENKIIDIPLIIGGKEIRTGKTGKVVMPSDHGHVLGYIPHGN